MTVKIEKIGRVDWDKYEISNLIKYRKIQKSSIHNRKFNQKIKIRLSKKIWQTPLFFGKITTNQNYFFETVRKIKPWSIHNIKNVNLS